MRRVSNKLISAVALSFLVSAGAVFADPINTADISSLAGGPNPKAVMMYNLGIKAYKEGSTEAAIIFFKRACDIDQNLADAQYNLAVIYQSQKRWKEAVPRYEEVLRLKPNDPDAQFQIGAIMQDMGNLQGAKDHYMAIAPNNPHYPEAQRRLAQLNNMPAGAPMASIPTTAPQVPAVTPPLQGVGDAQSNPSLNPVVSPYTGQAAPQTQPVQPTYTPPAVVAQTAAVVGQQPIAATAPPAASAPVPVMPNASLRVIATGFRAPAGLAFDKSGNLYVANYMINTIDRIAPDGTRTQFSSGANLRGPIGLIADEIGNIYVANYDGGTVARINPAGVSTVVATGFKKPYYLTLDRDGNLYVSQQEDNSIVRITLPRTTAALK